MGGTNGIKARILDDELSVFLMNGGNDISELLKSCKKISTSEYSKDKVLFSEESQPSGLFFIRRGNVVITQKNPTGDSTRLGTVAEGRCLGLSSLIRNKKHSTTAITGCDCLVDFVPKSDFFKLLEKYPLFSHNILLGLCRLLDQTEEEILMENKTQVKLRLAETLLEMAKTQEEPTATTLEISADELARIVGAEKEIVSACIFDFEKINYLRRHGATITLVNKEGLRNTILSSKPTKQ